MTHGHILVTLKGGKKKDNLELYTWHDGHTNEAIEDLITLPQYILEYAKFQTQMFNSPNIPRTKFFEAHHYHGHWFYQHFMYFYVVGAKADFPERSLEAYKADWENSRQLEFCMPSVANWMTWIRFDRWTIVPNREWCSYPSDPADIIVEVDEAEGGYLIQPVKMDDYFDEWLAETNIIEEINSQVPEFGKIEIREKKGQWAIWVPFMEILKGLMWNEIQLAKDVLSGKNKKKENKWMHNLGGR